MSVRKEENKGGKRKVGRRKGEFLWCYHKEYIFYNKEFPKVKLSDHNDILEKINWEELTISELGRQRT